MSRYWIDVDGLAYLSLAWLEIMEGNEIFVPKMTQFTVKELIEAIGHNIPSEVVGFRPSEKMHEILFNENERPIDKGNYYVVRYSQAGGN